jgi:hypothetical protein
MNSSTTTNGSIIDSPITARGIPLSPGDQPGNYRGINIPAADVAPSPTHPIEAISDAFVVEPPPIVLVQPNEGGCAQELIDEWHRNAFDCLQSLYETNGEGEDAVCWKKERSFVEVVFNGDGEPMEEMAIPLVKVSSTWLKNLFLVSFQALLHCVEVALMYYEYQAKKGKRGSLSVSIPYYESVTTFSFTFLYNSLFC